MLKRISSAFVLLGICWTVFLVNALFFAGHLNQFGIRPRHIASLPGIALAPFLHASSEHIMANTLPLLILGVVICLRNQNEFTTVTIAGILLSGGLTWMFGRNAYHIGASGLIFCFFGYLASLAFFEHKIGVFLLSIVCILGYGGILRGIFPTSKTISWEGHLAGFVSGIFLAWLIANVKKADGSPVAKTASSR